MHEEVRKSGVGGAGHDGDRSANAVQLSMDMMGPTCG